MGIYDPNDYHYTDKQREQRRREDERKRKAYQTYNKMMSEEHPIERLYRMGLPGSASAYRDLYD